MPYTIVEIPGLSTLRIPKIVNPQAEGAGAHSPEWMVKIKGPDEAFTNSKVSDYEEYSELLGYYAESSRYTSPNIACTSLHTSASVRHSELALIIPVTDSTSTLEQALNIGTIMEEIIVIRLGNIGTTKILLQSIIYKNCWMQRHQQQIDELLIRFTVGSKQNTIHVYKEDGVAGGKKVSFYDYILNKSDA